MKSSLDELAKLRQDNEDRTIALMEEGTEKQLAEIKLRYQRMRDEVAEHEKELATQQGGKLAPAQQSLIVAAYNQINALEQREMDKVKGEPTEAERQAMNRYLQEYGTFMQKKQAISDEYNRRIAQAATEGERLSLQKEMQKALGEIDMDKLKESINWELVFGDLERVSRESLKKIQAQLETFKESPEYKNMAIDQKKVIDEALNNIQSTLIEKGGLLGDLPNQLTALQEAQQQLTEAQNAYNEAIEHGTDAQKEAARRNLNSAEQHMSTQQRNVDQASAKATTNIQKLAGSITQLGTTSEMTLSQMGDLVGGLADTFMEAGEQIGGIIGAAFSLLDAISTQGIDGFAENVIKSLSGVAYSVNDFLTGWMGIDWGGESDPHLSEDMERLTESNKALEESINNLAEKMDGSSAVEMMDIYEVQMQKLQESISNTQQQLQRSGAAHNDGFMGFGGEHSSNKWIDKAMNANDWRRISEIVGHTVNSATDFWRLTSEQMYNVAENATDLYSKIKSYADDGHADAAQYMDEYISYYKQAEELTDNLNENLTQISFDSMYDNFIERLMDMDASAKDMADDISEYFMRAMMTDKINELYYDKLKEWWERFASYMSSDGALTEKERNELRNDYQSYVEEALKIRDQLAAATGYDSTSSTQQTATGKAFGTEMTQEQGAEISGRLTAIYESQLRGENLTQGIYNIANESRTILANSYLELQQINENTGEVVEPIKNMARRMANIESKIKNL